jgi:hypothetical protein
LFAERIAVVVVEQAPAIQMLQNARADAREQRVELGFGRGLRGMER